MAEPGQPLAASAAAPTNSLTATKIAVLGAGRLGEALIAGLIASGMVARENLVATAAHAARLEALAGRFGIRTTLENVRAVEGADLILLCVKPQTVADVLAEIQGALHEKQLLVSTAASVSTAYIEKLLARPVPVVRSMPNTPCLLRQGMTALSPGRHARKEDLELAGQVFGCLGRTMVLEEKHMDAVTGLSASGPAYIYMVIESLAQGGVKVGLPRDVATLLAAQTVRGAAAMVLETGEHPARLTDMVTTPAGCTIDGILELEEGGLRVTLIKAVVRATERAKELLHK
jgi:pyrroline-5-carboxylate reductase